MREISELSEALLKYIKWSDYLSAANFAQLPPQWSEAVGNKQKCPLDVSLSETLLDTQAR